MIYSRFDDTSGLYDLFEDAEGRAINSDLPVPMTGQMANGIGVPASEAGRPIPSSAKFVGKSWHARGIVATPGQGPALAGLGATTKGENIAVAFSLAGLAVLGLFVYFWYVPKDKEPAWRHSR